MVRIESWKVLYKNKVLDVNLFVAYSGPKISSSTTSSDRIEFDVLTITDKNGDFIYDGTTVPFKEIPDDIFDAIIRDNYLNPPQTVFVLDEIPEDDHIEADHRIIVKQSSQDDDSSYTYEDDDPPDDEQDEHKRF